jgi:nucleotide-binding universal stress UspA family protein
MFKHLLVPLDGSHLSEAALPAAAYLAERLKARVTLVHVIERHAPPEIHGERHLRNPQEAQAYLAEVRARAFPPDLDVKAHVHTAEVGDVAAGIVDHIAELAPDLIVMCTHGRGGLRGFLFGSIAQQVIGRGMMPVLMIQPEIGEVAARPFAGGHVLAPLDEAARHEAALAVAAEIARACLAALHLLVVVPTAATLRGEQAGTGRLLPGATAMLLDMAQENAATYLNQRLAALREAGLTATGEVRRGDPAAEIVQAAERLAADLVVLGTHGKAGMNALWSGSVAPRIASSTRLPLLFVPVRFESEGSG